MNNLWKYIEYLFKHRHAVRSEVKAPVDLQHVWERPETGKNYHAKDLHHHRGETVDLSATGVYFETDMDFTKGSIIKLKIYFDKQVYGNTTHMECTGRIVRVEHPTTSKVGVAVKINEQSLYRVP